MSVVVVVVVLLLLLKMKFVSFLFLFSPSPHFLVVRSQRSHLTLLPGDGLGGQEVKRSSLNHRKKRKKKKQKSKKKNTKCQSKKLRGEEHGSKRERKRMYEGK